MSRLFTILSNMIGHGERRDLLWTNPNPTSAFSSQTIALDTTYDAYEVEYSGYVGDVSQADLKFLLKFASPRSALTYVTGGTGIVSGTIWIGKRVVRVVSGSGLNFDDVWGLAGGAASWQKYTANTACVPTKIYGIRYGQNM